MKKKLLFGISIFILAIGCSKVDLESLESAVTNPQNEYSVSLNEALTLARDLDFESKTAITRSHNANVIDEYKAFGDQSPLFYVINYKGGGFVIISADKRITPILAHSEYNPFIFDDELPGGLILWMDMVSKVINDIKNGNTLYDNKIISQWNNFTSPSTRTDPISDVPVVTTEAIISTRWGQGQPNNNLLADIGCSRDSNGRPPVGCVPLACAQVMKYLKQPSNINWSSMNDSYTSTQTGSLDLQQLLKNLGTRSQLNVYYDCDGSSASTSDIPYVLKTYYGYSNTSYYGGYDLDKVREQIERNRPVVMRGTDTGGAGGHSWVCDGVQDYYDPPQMDPHATILEYAGSALHMNWGWNGRYNGYYAENIYNPSQYSFVSIGVAYINP